MRGRPGHAHTQSQSGNNNQRAQLANAYQELGKELASERLKVVGNYTLGKVIGEGAYGKVRIGTHRLTSTRVAIKQIPKALSASLTREIHHHRRLHHPNVTQLYEVIATENSIWLVTELCSGGELYDYLVEKGRLSEVETRQIFGELCLALHYVHEQGVVHRDLKLENVLLDERCHVKLSDFGFTREFEQGRLLETFCGTTGYAAPEMLLCKRYAGTEVDVWSLGIVLYCLLVGTLPFDDDDEEIMKAKIISGDYPDPEFLSSDVQDLIRKLLQKDPAKRLTVAQTLAHPWFSRTSLPEPDPQPLSPSLPNVIDLTDDSSAPPLNHSPKPHPPTLEPLTIPQSSPSVSEVAPAVSRLTHPTRDAQPSASSINSDATFHSATSGISQSDEGNDLPATPADSSASHDFARTAASLEDGSMDGQDLETPAAEPSTRARQASLSLHRMESQSTIRKLSEKASPVESAYSHAQTAIPHTVVEEDIPEEAGTGKAPDSEIDPTPSTSHPPSSFPPRTPARTKRRSVSSNLTNSPPASPSLSPPPIAPIAGTSIPDYLAESATKAPLVFSTELERNLLSSLSMMGFDTGQVVHSVLTDACDSASAMWWMLKKKVERREAQETRKQTERAKAAAALEKDMVPVLDVDSKDDVPSEEKRKRSTRRDDKSRAEVKSPEPAPPKGKSPSPDTTSHRPPVPLMLGQGSSAPGSSVLGATPVAPDVTFIPPTPVTLSYENPPPIPIGPGRKTPPPPSDSTSSFSLGLHPATPEKLTPISPERGKSKHGKPRSGSVSMLQRATTALSAAGLTRKKSSEAVKEDGTPGGSSPSSSLLRVFDDTRPSSAGSHASNKLTKAPPAPKDKERDGSVSSLATPTSSVKTTTAPSDITPDSPWQVTDESPVWRRVSALPAQIPQPYRRPTAPTPANSPGNSLTGTGKASGGLGSNSAVKTRNRASILNAFRTWFNEDKRKRKATPSLPTIPAGMAPYAYAYAQAGSSPRSPYNTASVKGKGKASGSATRPKRPSVSSRRSSSVNSRRSSVNSINQVSGVGVLFPAPINTNLLSRQRSDASRRSLGTRTPTSEREGPSRPSSVRSFSMTPITPAARAKGHSKSSSTSSAGSATPAAPRRTESPFSQQYHRRRESGSSTRVIRQVKHSHSRPNHFRSNSQASSIQSRASSRPTSLHETSDTEGALGLGRTESPMFGLRRSGEEPKTTTTVMVAHRKQSLFGPPSASIYASGRSSWKKSWGHEPPTWASRSVQSPSELPPDPSRPTIRDVFSNRGTASPNDDSDWTDEDDDMPAYLGGLGQSSQPLSESSSAPARVGGLRVADVSAPLPGSPSIKTAALPGMRSQAPAANKRTARFTKPAESSRHGKSSPTPMSSVHEEKTTDGVFADGGMNGWGRRQSMAGRSGPAFKNAIQEEDEDEEEE